MAKTSMKDFEFFKEQCELWIDFWGLREWRVTYVHDDDPDAETENASGWCMADMANMTAQIALRKTWPYKPDKSEIKLTAFHEVLELLIWPLFDVAVSRDFNMEKCNSARHNIIRRLENAFKILAERQSNAK